MSGFLLFMLACGDVETTATSSTPAEQKVDQPAATNEKISAGSSAKATLDITAQAEKIEQEALTPSPLETRKAAEKEGLTADFAGLIQKRSFEFPTEDTDLIALRTGIVLADTVLQIKELEKDALLKNLTTIEQNMKLIGAGEGLVFTLTELNTKVTNDAFTRDELLFELDEIVAYSRPNEGFGKDDTTGPLLQAGSWLTSINLLSQAMIKENKTETANSLFRHQKVAEYFLSYIRVEGKDKVPVGIMNTLKTTLESMIEISKKEQITKEDVERVAQETNVLLELI